MARIFFCRKCTFVRQPYKVSEIRPKEKTALVDMLVSRDEDHLFVHLINKNLGQSGLIQLDLSQISAKISGSTAIVKTLSGSVTGETVMDQWREFKGTEEAISIS